MKTRLKAPFVVSALICLSVSSAQAATLADFQFNSDLTSSDAGTSWTTTDLTSGGGVPTGFDGSLGQPAPSLSLTMGDINDGTLQDDDYYSFTVTPTSGTLDFTQFEFDIYKASGGADVFGRLYSSQDGFTTEIGNGSISATTSWETKTIDLTGLAATGVATEFRLYMITGGTFGPNRIRLDNFTLEGDPVVIPEPSVALLSFIGGLFLLRRKR